MHKNEMSYKIEAINNKENYIIIRVSRYILDLDKTLFCGQVFIWDRKEYSNGVVEYTGYIRNRPYIIQSVYDRNSKEYLYKIISNDVNAILHEITEYFDLETDYSINTNRLTEYEKAVYEYSSGIRIIRQQILETIITFIISQRNSMVRIRNTILKLRNTYGKSTQLQVKNKTYTINLFPTIEVLSNLSIQELKDIGLGYRADYIYTLLRNNPNKYLQITHYSTQNLLETLELIHGVGPKVANCILLFGYHRLEAFPIDTWIQKVIDSQYQSRIDTSRFGENGRLAGLMQQYIFYFEAGGKYK